MSESKEKDRILADIKAFKPLHEIEGLDKHLPELERSGLVKVWRNEQGKPITIRLTNKGKIFFNNEGFSFEHKKRYRELFANHSKLLIRSLYSILGSVIAGLIIWLLTRST